MRSIIVALCALLVCAGAAAGDVYKWKDKDGRVHYGDKPKAEPAQPVEIRAPGETSVATGGDDAARAAECQRRRAKLDTYRKAPSISETDNLGKTREYTEAERQQFIALYEKQADDACAPPPPQ